MSILKKWIGKKVLVRSRNEGVNVGIVVDADETGVEIKEARRLWYHKPASSETSWYEGVSVSGLSEDSKVSNTALAKVIIENYSLTLCTDEAYESIMKHTPNGS